MAELWNDGESEEEENDVFAMAETMYHQYQAGGLLVNKTRGKSGTSASRQRIIRDREVANEQLMRDYFVEHPMYPLDTFKERFRIRRDLFIRIMERNVHFDDYFKQKPDACGKYGFSPYAKMTIALRMLANGTPFECNDDYLKIARSTSHEACQRFCRAICNVFGPEYLRRPTKDDLQRFLEKAEHRGFPGMLGSLNCMHWEWRNCQLPTKVNILVTRVDQPLSLESVASYDTWFWHAYFGPACSLNDLNVIYRSPFFYEVLEGKASRVRYTVNDIVYKQGYYLADGIYPKCLLSSKQFQIIRQGLNNCLPKSKSLTLKMLKEHLVSIDHNLELLRDPTNNGIGKIYKRL